MGAERFVLTKKEFDEIAAGVIANSARLKRCPRHMFPIQERKPGQKFTCFHCKGEMDAGRVISYCEGFKAAGGDPREVWGEFKR